MKCIAALTRFVPTEDSIPVGLTALKAPSVMVVAADVHVIVAVATFTTANPEPLAAPVTSVSVAACAGTTDKSPNPSEATATADTFFNEIVFTIFLSFSQIKDDPLSGW
jgi:hypothetical protein